jgi:hypothetical protein
MTTTFAIFVFIVSAICLIWIELDNRTYENRRNKHSQIKETQKLNNRTSNLPNSKLFIRSKK